MADQSYIYAVGKRKTAVAQVRLYLDQGPIVVDEKLMEDYLGVKRYLKMMKKKMINLL